VEIKTFRASEIIQASGLCLPKCVTASFQVVLPVKVLQGTAGADDVEIHIANDYVTNIRYLSQHFGAVVSVALLDGKITAWGSLSAFEVKPNRYILKAGDGSIVLSSTLGMFM
jgi:hypothetical protein